MMARSNEPQEGQDLTSAKRARQSAEREQDLVPSNERRGRKSRTTFQLSTELLDELRDIVVSLSGPPDRLTLSDLAESALRREAQRLKQMHMSGNRFPKRSQELRSGRPIK
jgi:hypothetical protein